MAANDPEKKIPSTAAKATTRSPNPAYVQSNSLKTSHGKTSLDKPCQNLSTVMPNQPSFLHTELFQ